MANHKTVGAVTAQCDFGPATPEGECMFSVRAGIPIGAALDQLSGLMSSSIAAVEALACGGWNSDAYPGALWETVNQMNAAYALVQSIHQGHNTATRQNEMQKGGAA